MDCQHDQDPRAGEKFSYEFAFTRQYIKFSGKFETTLSDAWKSYKIKMHTLIMSKPERAVSTSWPLAVLYQLIPANGAMQNIVQQERWSCNFLVYQGRNLA